MTPLPVYGFPKRRSLSDSLKGTTGKCCMRALGWHAQRVLSAASAGCRLSSIVSPTSRELSKLESLCFSRFSFSAFFARFSSEEGKTAGKGKTEDNERGKVGTWSVVTKTVNKRIQEKRDGVRAWSHGS